MIIRSTRYVVAVLFGLLVYGSANAYSCPPFSEELVNMTTTSIVSSSEAAVEAFIQAQFQALSLQMRQFDETQISAIKTLTAQVATAAKAQINANVALKSGEMAAIGQLETSKQQLKIYQEFSAATGQGFDPCSQLTAQTNVTVANGQSAAMAAAAISNLSAAPGRYGNPEGYINKMFNQRRLMFGTLDEAKLGFGVQNTSTVTTSTGAVFPLAGADTNAQVLFADSADPRVLAAKGAYLDHMAGAPDVPLTADMAALPSGKEYLALKGRKDAVMSVALNSLATVSAENTPNGEIGVSKMKALRDLVGQYYGNDAKARWQGWASQNARGLMVDQMKIEAALLSVEADHYQQAQRTEAVLGTLLALEAQREYKPALNAAIQSSENVRSRPAIR